MCESLPLESVSGVTDSKKRCQQAHFPGWSQGLGELPSSGLRSPSYLSTVKSLVSTHWDAKSLSFHALYHFLGTLPNFAILASEYSQPLPQPLTHKVVVMGGVLHHTSIFQSPVPDMSTKSDSQNSTLASSENPAKPWRAIHRKEGRGGWLSGKRRASCLQLQGRP